MGAAPRRRSSGGEALIRQRPSRRVTDYRMLVQPSGPANSNRRRGRACLWVVERRRELADLMPDGAQSGSSGSYRQCSSFTGLRR